MMMHRCWKMWDFNGFFDCFGGGFEWDFVRVDVLRCYICLDEVRLFLSHGSDR